MHARTIGKRVSDHFKCLPPSFFSIKDTEQGHGFLEREDGKRKKLTGGSSS